MSRRREGETPSARSRLVWFVFLYAVSLGGFAAVVYALRALVAP